jgi:hypothetical protein
MSKNEGVSRPIISVGIMRLTWTEHMSEADLMKLVSRDAKIGIAVIGGAHNFLGRRHGS